MKRSSVAGWPWGQRQATAPLPASGQLQDGSWWVCFSPLGGGTAAIVAEITKATNSIRVLADNFTSPPIADALVAAHNRNVDVAVILDKGQGTAQYAQVSYLNS
jgi:phosphatidylserine/phosphatidylglycerophosphate/cardiolipin synthase-like enzyme